MLIFFLPDSYKAKPDTQESEMTENRRKSILCPNCNKLISVDEPACPHCGVSRPGSWWKSLLTTKGLFSSDAGKQAARSEKYAAANRFTLQYFRIRSLILIAQGQYRGQVWRYLFYAFGE